jgi:hypothetical protein
MPICAFVFMRMLPSQPTTPPTINVTIQYMLSSSIFVRRSFGIAWDPTDSTRTAGTSGARHPDAVALDAAVKLAAVLVLLEEGGEVLKEHHFAFGPRGSIASERHRNSQSLFVGFLVVKLAVFRHSRFVPKLSIGVHSIGSPTKGRGFRSAPAHNTHVHSAWAVAIEKNRQMASHGSDQRWCMGDPPRAEV